MGSNIPPDECPGAARRRSRFAGIGLSILLLGAAAPDATVTAVKPIALHDGVNVVPAFLPDGAPATIVQAWRANGNAHGHHDWLVLAAAAEGHRAGEVTLADPDTNQLSDAISDAPFDGERVLDAVRFAHGQANGRPASLMVESRLDDPPSHIPADHATATIRIFRLEATGGAPGESPLEFRLIATRHTGKRYCNADLAMAQTLSLPLPITYGGPNRIDGCFPG